MWKRCWPGAPEGLLAGPQVKVRGAGGSDHHDHLLVPHHRVREAIEVLETLSARYCRRVAVCETSSESTFLVVAAASGHGVGTAMLQELVTAGRNRPASADWS